MKPINPEHIRTIVNNIYKTTGCEGCRYLVPRNGYTSLCNKPITCFKQISYANGMKVLTLLELTNEAGKDK